MLINTIYFHFTDNVFLPVFTLPATLLLSNKVDLVTFLFEMCFFCISLEPSPHAAFLSRANFLPPYLSERRGIQAYRPGIEKKTRRPSLPN